MNKQIKSDLLLVLITVVWGSTFVIVKNAISSIPVFNFLTLRFALAFVILSIFFYKSFKYIDKKTIIYSILTGLSMFLGYTFQTIGLKYTNASRSGFITGFYIILVPIFETVILNKKIEFKTCMGIIMSFIGLILLSIHINNLKHLTLNIGDLYTVLCAVFFSLQIISVSYFAPKTNVNLFTIIQISVVALMSMSLSFVVEKPFIPTDISSWMSLFITGVLATALAYIIQNSVQKNTTATHAALIFVLEPIFSAIFAFFISHDTMEFQSIIGAIFMIFGILLSEF